MENADSSLLPSRLQRATVAFYALAAVCLVLSVLYGNYYVLIEQFGVHLPPLSSAGSALTFSEIHGLFRLLALLLAGLGTTLLLAGQRAPVQGMHASLRPAFRRYRPLNTLLFVAAVGASLWYADARFANNEELSNATLSMLAEGSADAPFQYRALVPWLVGALSDLLPLGAERLYWLVEAGAAFLIFVAFSRFLALFVGQKARARLFALAVFLPLYFTLASPYRINDFLYPWDTLAVAFFTAGLVGLYRKNWWAFYPIFVLGTFNRETTCFLTIVYLLVYVGQESNRRLALHTAAQFVLWIGVKALVGWIYAENTLASGAHGFFETHMLRNLDFLANPLSYLYFLQVMGGLWLVVALFGRHLEHRFLKRALWVTGPFFVGMFLVGLLAEIRIFSELIPLFTAAFLLILHRVARSSADELPEKRPAATSSTVLQESRP